MFARRLRAADALARRRHSVARLVCDPALSATDAFSTRRRALAHVPCPVSTRQLSPVTYPATNTRRPPRFAPQRPAAVIRLLLPADFTFHNDPAYVRRTTACQHTTPAYTFGIAFTKAQLGSSILLFAVPDTHRGSRNERALPPGVFKSRRAVRLRRCMVSTGIRSGKSSSQPRRVAGGIALSITV